MKDKILISVNSDENLGQIFLKVRDKMPFQYQEILAKAMNFKYIRLSDIKQGEVFEIKGE